MANPDLQYRLGTWDYIVVAAVILSSTAVGLYYVWQSKKSKNTRDFLVATRSIGVAPLVMSTVATILSPSILLGQPMETYTNGIQMILSIFGLYLSHVFAMYATVPVFFRLNVSTVNQYVEYRFNRLLRIVPAFLGLLQKSIMAASFTYVTALILSDATGLTFWSSMAVICGIVIVYTSLGGFTAVIWTDVLQMTVIFVALGVLMVKGTLDVGSVSEIWNRNYEGNRTIMFRLDSSTDSNYSFWSITIGTYFMLLGGAMLSQNGLQRQMANKSLNRARMTLFLSCVCMSLISLAVTWIGMVIYARYYDCDPLINKQIKSRDQISVLFAMEIFTGNAGLMGLYISGILSATLSTLSSVLNSFATVVIVDFVKPYYPNMPDKTTTILSKIFGFMFGGLIVALTMVVDNFGGIVQVIHAVAGTTLGPTAGIFILGFFLPWATSTGAMVGYLAGLSVGWWASVGRITSKVPYYTLPVNTDGCAAKTFDFFNRTMVNFTEAIAPISEFESIDPNPSANPSPIMAFGVAVFFAAQSRSPILESAWEIVFSFTQFTVGARGLDAKKTTALLVAQLHDLCEHVFGLYRIIPIWYTGITMSIVVIVGMAVSIAFGAQDPEKIDPRLISPFTWFILRRIPKSGQRLLGFKSEKFHGDLQIATTLNGFTDFKDAEMEIMKPLSTSDEKDSTKNT